jgi:RimJ/RimL family protein N-acetyltransferase/8-oxo-dGTP pyrophosphatase MutT (NUDIX family)
VGDQWPTLTDGTITLTPEKDDGSRTVRFVITHENVAVGGCEVRRLADDSTAGDLWWALSENHRGLGLATRAVRSMGDWALTSADLGGLGLLRIEARVSSRNAAALRVATRSGLRREGVQRVVPGTGEEPETSEYVVFARLSTDPPLTEPASFRALLNSFLPRKRAIAQVLVRDERDRVLLCQLTYKDDWDLPGGVVEVGESPQAGAAREVAEELGLTIVTSDLLLTDWLPAWSGWDDALCLVFDGGQHDANILDSIVPERREIRSAQFCTPSEVAARTKDFTARRINAALGRLNGVGPAYTHSGAQP